MNTAITRLGKYEIRSVLGKGAMAVVYLAYDPVLEREVAIKIIASAILGEEELKQRFEREAKAIARLQHPNIVTIYDLGYDADGSPYIAMEHLKGCDLERKIKQASLTLNDKLGVVVQAARGLAQAHEIGIIHRDVKPANLFITDSGATKVMDFGVARWAHSSQTQTGQILGTAEYMPPEQIEGIELDGRADIFSLGVILYQLLTSKRPFEGPDYMSVFFKIVNVEPPEIVLPSGEKIPELQAIVNRALAKNRDERYRTAMEFADELKAFSRARTPVLSEQTLFGTSTASQPTAAVTGARAGATLKAEVSRRTMVGPLRASPTRRIEVVATPVQEEAPQRSSRLRIVAAVGLLLAAGAGAGLYTLRGGARKAPPPDVESTVETTPTPPIEDLGARFELAQNLLEHGKIAEAFEAVNHILRIDPDSAKALALREEILKRSTEIDVSPSSAPSPSQGAEVSRPSPTAVSADLRVAQKVDEVGAALRRGDVERAEALLAEGEAIKKSDPRWADLAREIVLKKRDVEEERERAAQLSRVLQNGATLLASGDLDQAIQVYGEALKLDPGNAAAQTGLTQATAIKAQRALAVTRFTESETEFEPAAGRSRAPEGFAVDGVQVKSGTTDDKFPAQLFIEHVPEQPKPGEPYLVRVRLLNSGQRPINVKSLELVSTFGDRPPTGKGIAIRPRLVRVDVRVNGVLHEVQGVWSAEQKKGSIKAIVTLVGDDKLVKTTSW